MTKSGFATVVAIGVMWAAKALADGSAASDLPLNQRRPQEEAIAAAPLPYREELVTFDNPAAPQARLAGTLSLPPGAGPFPAVVLISGSGRNDRNEEVAGHKLALVLADALTRQGRAVLRYDKRGVGKSTGDYRAATTLDFASDAAAAVAYLRSRPDMVGTQLGLVGHSEGATIAAILAAKDPRLAFIVMLAGFSLPGKVLVAEQIRRMDIADGQTPASATQTYNLNRRLFDAIAASKDQTQAQARVRKVLAAAKPEPTEAESHQVLHFAEVAVYAVRSCLRSQAAAG